MKAIDSVALFSRDIPFKTSFATGGWRLDTRRVLYLRIRDDEGRAGVGEAAPLEQFGTESFEDCELALRHAADALIAQGRRPESIESILQSLLPTISVPTARCAVETALLDLRARQHGVSLACLLGGANASLGILVNAVIPAGADSATVAAAREAIAAGYGCVKLKVGGDAVEDDARRIAAVREAVGPETLLRLDANGAWDRDTALEALGRFDEFDIEYVEQPVPPRDVEGLALLKQSSPVSVAADESIASLADAWRLLDDDACDAFVLKPMVLGSLAECARFVSTAHERWKQVVFTSLLDSAVGRHAVAQLVASMPELAQYHHGLATGTLLLSDLHADDIAGGVLRLPEGAGLGFDPDLSTCTRLPGIPS